LTDSVRVRDHSISQQEAVENVREDEDETRLAKCESNGCTDLEALLLHAFLMPLMAAELDGQ